MRYSAGALLVGLALLVGPGSAQAQVMMGGPVVPYRVPQQYFSAPGYFGTTYGVPSYGLRQTYTTFTTPYGPGYAYGYPPASYLPGPYGAGLWAPAAVPRPYVWRTPYYGTFAVPIAPRPVVLPPIGVYAPGFGPGLAPRVYYRR